MNWVVINTDKEEPMKEYNRNNWWDIFNPENKVEGTEVCPLLPMAGSSSWQKGLALFYCPCRTVTLNHKEHQL
jgi:hypothetical protein